MIKGAHLCIDGNAASGRSSHCPYCQGKELPPFTINLGNLIKDQLKKE
jgi:hypothetical protein